MTCYTQSSSDTNSCNTFDDARPHADVVGPHIFAVAVRAEYTANLSPHIADVSVYSEEATALIYAE